MTPTSTFSTPEFVAEGLCAQTDPEAFYPEPGRPATEAKRVCRGCPVRPECLEWALIHDERFGVWGGTSAQERRTLRRRRALPGPAEQRQATKRDTARRMYAQGRSKADISNALRLSGSTLNAYLADQPTAVPHPPGT